MKVRHGAIVAGAFLVISSSLFGQTDCNTAFSHTDGPDMYSLGDPIYQQHNTGNHSWVDNTTGTCIYSGMASTSGPTQCSVEASAQSDVTPHDIGQLKTLYSLYTHYTSAVQKGGSTTSNGGSATADTEGAFSVKSCLVSCAVSITISGSGDGSTFSVSFPSGALWSDSHYYKEQCQAKSLPKLQSASTCSSPTSPYPTQTTSNGYYTWDTTQCQWVWVNCQPGINCSASPIIIDTTNTGFAFTDPAKGEYVLFDLTGNGSYIKASWPKVGSGNAWLVYDRDGDGVIKDGSELFGNWTPHSDGDVVRTFLERNGFLALQWFDHPANGGNGDLIIDKNDGVWRKLRLWIDTHCYKTPDIPCQSLPSELYTLPAKGVTSLSLVYTTDPGNHDAIGNEWKFSAVVNPEMGNNPTVGNGHHLDTPSREGAAQRSKDGRMAYDVNLKTIP